GSAVALALPLLEGPSNNVARRAAKAADVGDVARRVDDVGDVAEDVASRGTTGCRIQHVLPDVNDVDDALSANPLHRYSPRITVLGEYPGYVKTAKRAGLDWMEFSEWSWLDNSAELHRRARDGDIFFLGASFEKIMEGRERPLKWEYRQLILDEGFEYIRVGDSEWLVPRYLLHD
ncbi:MAG: hypothetical protein JXA14_09225, partial [Anaerolineae bacterium]|nr:hypothetical protein [Anaerolineae bacterium]